MNSIETMKEIRKIEINQFLKNPKKGFFGLQKMTKEEAQHHFDNLQVNDTLLYVNHTNQEVYLYEIQGISKSTGDVNLEVTFLFKKIVDEGEFVERPVPIKNVSYVSPNFLMQFVAVLRKDSRSFKVIKDPYVPSYTVTVDGRFESTPTGKIKQFGSKDFVVNQVKSFVSGAAQPTIFEPKFDKGTNQFLREGSEVVLNESKLISSGLIERLNSIGNHVGSAAGQTATATLRYRTLTLDF